MIDPRKRASMMELDSRKRIFQHIQKVPGIHLRKLQKDLNMPLGTLEYHLRQMERHEFISTLREGRYKAHFVRNAHDPTDRRYFYYLRRDMPRRIVRELLDDYEVTRAKLLDRLPIRSSTLSHHLRKLVQGQIVQPFWLDGRKIYLIADRDRVRRLLTDYQDTFAETAPAPEPLAEAALAEVPDVAEHA